jgi:hypothetical protein
VSAATPAAQGGCAPDVLRLSDGHVEAIHALLDGFGLEFVVVPAGTTIPGSYWGDSEAGLLGSRVYARPDTPVHSVLHEAGHAICMGEARRGSLATDAGGDFDEENAVCYLQIVLAGRVPGVGRGRLMADMDAWGYTFRLGSAHAWFEHDAADAAAWLRARGLPAE